MDISIHRIDRRLGYVSNGNLPNYPRRNVQSGEVCEGGVREDRKSVRP
jgi:hypothetical protein